MAPGACARCAEPGDFRRGPCPRCRARPPPFIKTVSPFTHLGPVAHAIHLMKYEDRPELARPLGRELARECAKALEGAPMEVCAIPLHRKRFYERGFDQAELIAHVFARASGRRHLPSLLERTKATSRQVGLREVERERNMHGAFTASSRAQGRSLLLVDDVFTTGATARAAAAALKASGAKEVWVVTVARACLDP